MNILEGNKLIAEFMNITPKKFGNKYQWSDQPFYYVDGDTAEEVINKASGYFKYSTSWDWLMPVVEKIEDLKNTHGFSFVVTIYQDYCRISSKNYSLEENYFEGEGDSKLEATYKAVLESIQWYNNQNK